ncbi:hypothetical protein [Saccharopolyspora sp. NPDC002376]
MSTFVLGAASGWALLSANPGQITSAMSIGLSCALFTLFSAPALRLLHEHDTRRTAYVAVAPTVGGFLLATLVFLLALSSSVE